MMEGYTRTIEFQTCNCNLWTLKTVSGLFIAQALQYVFPVRVEPVETHPSIPRAHNSFTSVATSAACAINKPAIHLIRSDLINSRSVLVASSRTAIVSFKAVVKASTSALACSSYTPADFSRSTNFKVSKVMLAIALLHKENEVPSGMTGPKGETQPELFRPRWRRAS